jgi:hypothetical protein
VCGLLTASANGQWVSFSSSTQLPGTAWNNAWLPWAMVAVGTNGTINTMTASGGHYGGDYFR